MILKKGKFTVDRQKLVIYSTDVITTLIACNAIKDIVLGGEFIITAEDILEKESTFRISFTKSCLKAIPAHHSIINIVYKPN
jgi:hypothetical protein